MKAARRRQGAFWVARVASCPHEQAAERLVVEMGCVIQDVGRARVCSGHRHEQLKQACCCRLRWVEGAPHPTELGRRGVCSRRCELPQGGLELKPRFATREGSGHVRQGVGNRERARAQEPEPERLEFGFAGERHEQRGQLVLRRLGQTDLCAPACPLLEQEQQGTQTRRLSQHRRAGQRGEPLEQGHSIRRWGPGVLGSPNDERIEQRIGRRCSECRLGPFVPSLRLGPVEQEHEEALGTDHLLGVEDAAFTRAGLRGLRPPEPARQSAGPRWLGTLEENGQRTEHPFGLRGSPVDGGSVEQRTPEGQPSEELPRRRVLGDGGQVLQPRELGSGLACVLRHAQLDGRSELGMGPRPLALGEHEEAARLVQHAGGESDPSCRKQESGALLYSGLGRQGRDPCQQLGQRLRTSSAFRVLEQDAEQAGRLGQVACIDAVRQGLVLVERNPAPECQGRSTARVRGRNDLASLRER
jgi:hypothetical protein